MPETAFQHVNVLVVGAGSPEWRRVPPSAPAAGPDLAAQIIAFEKYYNAAARPFDWKFTRTDLNQLLACVRRHDRHAPNPVAA
jgi:hypothetical protein